MKEETKPNKSELEKLTDLIIKTAYELYLKSEQNKTKQQNEN